MRIRRSEPSNISPTVLSAATPPKPQPMHASPAYDSAAQGHTSRKSSIENCNGCAYAGCDSRQHSRGGRHRRHHHHHHHQCAASPVGLLISGMTQTMRSLQAMNEQERIVREQTEMAKDPANLQSRDDGKDYESARGMDGESETGIELEASDKNARRRCEQHWENHNPGTDLPGHQAVITGAYEKSKHLGR